jgi:hypothetical protein
MWGIDLAEPVFRVQVRLERDYVDAYGQRTPLQAGMLHTAGMSLIAIRYWKASWTRLGGGPAPINCEHLLSTGNSHNAGKPSNN